MRERDKPTLSVTLGWKTTCGRKKMVGGLVGYVGSRCIRTSITCPAPPCISTLPLPLFEGERTLPWTRFRSAYSPSPEHQIFIADRRKVDDRFLAGGSREGGSGLGFAKVGEFFEESTGRG